MPTLVVNRNTYQQSKRWEEIIKSIWNQDEVSCRMYYGCNPYQAEAIVTSFRMVHGAYQTRSLIRIHCFSIIFDYLTMEEDAKEVMVAIMNYFSPFFQNICVLKKGESGRYEATFVVNAVSYRDGRKFHDNNKAYIYLKNHLERFLKSRISIRISDQTLFSDDSHSRNYTKIL